MRVRVENSTACVSQMCKHSQGQLATKRAGKLLKVLRVTQEMRNEGI